MDKAVHEELAAICEEIIATQAVGIEQRQTWLEQCDGRQGDRLSLTV